MKLSRMSQARMSQVWLLPVCAMAMAGLPASGVRAQAPQQTQSQYNGPGDAPEAPSTLDKGYGLSFLGMPGSESQQNPAGPVKDPPPTTDLFPGQTTDPLQAATQTDPPRLPRVRPSETETPLYTTTEGSETGDRRQASGETPLFDDGSDTTDGGPNRPLSPTPQ